MRPPPWGQVGLSWSLCVAGPAFSGSSGLRCGRCVALPGCPLGGIRKLAAFSFLPVVEWQLTLGSFLAAPLLRRAGSVLRPTLFGYLTGCEDEP
jgi:hypothetical protein